MKGLLIKDFRLTFLNTRIFYLVAAVVFLIFMGRNDESIGYITTFITAICLMLTVSTISYDDYDKGLSFLFTLPISRKLYVTEKYVFSMLSGCMGLIVSCIATVLFNLAHGKKAVTMEFLLSTAIMCALLLIVVACTIPVRLKFGENGRIYVLILVGVCFGVGGAASAIVELEFVTTILEALSGMSEAAITWGLYVAAALALVISWMISVKVMRNKSL